MARVGLRVGAITFIGLASLISCQSIYKGPDTDNIKKEFNLEIMSDEQTGGEDGNGENSADETNLEPGKCSTDG